MRILKVIFSSILIMMLLALIVSYEVFADTERLAPDGETFTLTELSGTYEDVDDDPDSPDGNWLTASGNNVDTAVLASFPTPSGNPTVGADLQEFRVLVRQYDEGQSGTPNARIELWENGGMIRAGSDTPVPQGGTVLSFTWNANEISTADGSQVECYVYGTKAGGSPSARNTVEVGAIEWNVDYTAGAVAPTVTTSAATNVEATTATLNGAITNTGGENADYRGFEWGTSSGSYSANWTEGGDFGVDSFNYSGGTYNTGTTYYYRAMAHNSAGWGYGSEQSFLTKPAAPTNVSATDGDHTDKVVITWTKSTGATDYQVYRDGTPLGWAGDVATYDDTGADAPTITAGDAVASDGIYLEYVALNINGESANNGTTHTYKVRAKNATGESSDSDTDNGYRGVGSLTFQWHRSSGDSDADYSEISGATTESYNDTGAPANGDGRYYKCVLNAAGASEQTTTPDRGYRDTPDAPTVTTSDATDVTAESATLNGAITDTGGENADTRGFQWGTETGIYTDNWTESDSYGVGSFSHGISSLIEDETYYYRAIAHNSQGWGFGNEISFVATSEQIPDTPTGLYVRQWGENTIRASWNPIAGVTGYLLLVSTVDYPDSPAGNYAVAYSGNTSDVELTGYDLELTTYYFSLWSHINPYSLSYARASIGGTISDELATLATILSTGILLVPLILLSILAFWTGDIVLKPTLFVLSGAMSIFVGIYQYDIYVSHVGLAISLLLITYGIVCFAYTFRLIFWRG